MPTEHEYKFLLSTKVTEILHEGVQIKQGYLASAEGMSLRVRYSNGSWVLTLKQKVENRVVEIETFLSEDDGLDLWDKCTGKITKQRYVVYDHAVHGGSWEVDLFFDDGNIYFALTEIELPLGMERPPVPELIKPYVLYEVPLGDERFANKNLGDVAKATDLYNSFQIIK